jgi:putative membrane protein
MSTQNPEGLTLDPSAELASQRTALSLERTMMSADRTQMSALRTSLSLIGFGFTIYKFFDEMGKQMSLAEALGHPARNLGVGLVVLGVALLIAGLFNRYNLMRALGQRRQVLYDRGLLRTPPAYKTSANMVVSILLLIGGLLVLLGIITRLGPFG